MKKIAMVMTFVIILTSIFSTGAFAEQQFSIFLNNEKIELDNAPVFEKQRTMVSLNSSLFEKIGVTTRYDESSEKVWIDSDNLSIEFTIGNEKSYIHKKQDSVDLPEPIDMDVAPFKANDNVFIPLRFAAESLGALVEWDGLKNAAMISFYNETDIIPVETPVEYSEIDIFKLSDEQLIEWVQSNRENMGIYQKSINNKTYVLICAGERPTGGYSIKINSVTMVSPNNIYISSEVISPLPDTIVTQAFTYPCKLISVEDGNELTVDGLINSDSNTEETIQFETVGNDIITTDEELSAWVNTYSKQAGVYHKQKEDYVYVLAAAGQKNTGGYSISISNIIKTKSDEAYVYAAVKSPDPDMMVIQVITWPYTVIRFKDDNVKQVRGEIQDLALTVQDKTIDK